MPEVFKIGHHEALPNDEGYSRQRSAKAHAILASEEGSTVNYELNCPAWYKPYDEVLLDTDFERLLTILTGTEVAIFQRHWESVC
jgi:hypothetical protein